MSKVAYGITSIKAGGIDAVTGLPTGLASVGDVYKDTASITETDGTSTKHFAELKNDAVVQVDEPGEEVIEFHLMDTAADTMVSWCGGTVTEVVDEPDVWNKPRTVPNIEKSLEITFEDGTVITYNRTKVVAKRVGNPTKKGIYLIQVKATVLTPLVDAVPPATVTDPEAA